MKTIYIAGPDVFHRNATDIGEYYSQLCEKYQMHGLYPLDNVIDTSQPLADKVIFEANCNMILQSDIVIANLNHFRGPEPDSGTVWELGYAKGLGKKTIGYIADSRSIVEKVREFYTVVEDKDAFWCEFGMMIENFNNPLNLMLQYGVDTIIIGGFEDALSYINSSHSSFGMSN